MGELDSEVPKRASMFLFFDAERLVPASLKSFAGFGGLASFHAMSPYVSDVDLARAVREAWEGAEYDPVYDEAAIDASWLPLEDFFGVERHPIVRYVTVNRLEGHIGVVPSEWKGDNRDYLSKARIELPLDTVDEELGAAVRRAMELTTS